MIVERHGRKSQRWRWSTEMRYSWSSSWRTHKRGYAWTQEGAESKARRACFFEPGTTRREILIVDEFPAAEEREPIDPIPSRLLSDPVQKDPV